MTLESLDKFIRMHNRGGDASKNLVIRLDLSIQASGNASEVIERFGQARRERCHVGVGSIERRGCG